MDPQIDTVERVPIGKLLAIGGNVSRKACGARRPQSALTVVSSTLFPWRRGGGIFFYNV